MNVEIEIVFFFGFINFYFLFYFILCIYWMVIFRNARLLSLPWVAAVGCCSGGAAQSPICESSCNVRGNVRMGEVDDDRGMVSYVEEVLNLGGRDMLSRMRDGTTVCVVLVMLMEVVGVGCLREVAVDCLEMVSFIVESDIFVLGGVTVVLMMQVKMVVGCVVKLVLWCSNGSGDFL